MLNLRLYILQRLTALIMAPLVLVHLVAILYAIEGGLTVGEILGRTRGSVLWALFYGLFVLAASVHAAIGVRVVVAEWVGLRPRILSWLTWALALGLAIPGLRAVWAVTWA